MRNATALGVMFDMSRNAVMNVESFKNYLEILAKMGYNCVFLYTEDTYEVDGEPYFGYMRGRYTKEEMCELDTFANEIGIEIIPCIQTLAHLSTIAKWRQYPQDTEDILMVDDERTYEFIDHMFSTLSRCFKTKRLHVGMDEAHMLGRGKHLDQYGYETVDVLMKRHLKRVCEIADKYGYELMIWSDMLFRPWNDGRYETIDKVLDIPKEYIDALPENVIPVYWDYGSGHYDEMLINHNKISDKTWYAGGAITWGGFAPFNKMSLEAMPDAVDACKRHGVNNIFMTIWGDSGNECSKYSVLPTLFDIAERVKGNTDEALIKAKFEELFGISFDDFMLLDIPNFIALPENSLWVSPSKYMLYSDPFLGFLDSTVRLGEGKKFIEYEKTLSEIAKKSEEYGHLFDTLGRLCGIMKYKYELGVKTRAAYKAGDKAELLRLANEDYTKVIEAIPAFAEAFEKQWLIENKPHGLEVQHYRFGGLSLRMEHCKKRLIQYAEGKIDRIMELEEDILTFRKDGESIMFNGFLTSHTCNVTV